MSVIFPIVWIIAGSDSSGGAGIEADIKTCHSLGVHACSMITAITAQNNQNIISIQFTQVDFFENQLTVLKNNFPPDVIKIGMLGNIDLIKCLLSFLSEYTGLVVLDPVLFSSSGTSLFCSELPDYLAQLSSLFPYVDMLTPNIIEAEKILGYKIVSQHAAETAANDILGLGVKSVVIKGGHLDGEFSQDYWSDGAEPFWLASKKLPKMNYRGTGCTFSSAICACLASGYDIKDAIVIAKMYVNNGIRNAKYIDSGSAILSYAGWPEDEIDLPYLSHEPLTQLPKKFMSCESQLGIYPVVDSIEWIKKLIPLGITTIQLRIKTQYSVNLEDEIRRSITLAKQNNVSLYINDFWELAVSYGAYGVHLGQEDLLTADIEKIRNAGLRLGVSTHCYHEVARAHSLNPSYVACGPIYPTTSKMMPFSPQGVSQLQRWRRTLSYPLVAIGGINQDNIADVIATNVNGVAMISAITQMDNNGSIVRWLKEKLQ